VIEHAAAAKQFTETVVCALPFSMARRLFVMPASSQKQHVIQQQVFPWTKYSANARAVLEGSTSDSPARIDIADSGPRPESPDDRGLPSYVIGAKAKLDGMSVEDRVAVTSRMRNASFLGARSLRVNRSKLE
jgi:hypothetical protein